MNKILMLFCLLLSGSFGSNAQTLSLANINPEMPADIKKELFTAVDTLIANVNAGRSLVNLTGTRGSSLSMSFFESLKEIQNNKKENDAHFYKPQIINAYQLDKNQYYISIAFLNANFLRAIFNVVSVIDHNKVTFSIPVYYETRNWKTTTTGNVTYHYPDQLNLSRANQFNQTNTVIAEKLGLAPEKLDFYLCDNYQDVLCLLGYSYDSETAGVINDGYGVDDHTIFSIEHNEDFSHDLFHYYAGKVRTHGRNSAAEEGMAYTWGNAYYVDDNGGMITQQQLVKALKVYIQQHPDISLLELFRKNPMIFYANIKVRSLISSLICDEIERKKGLPAIKALIDCGTGDDNYFAVVNNMIGINSANFDKKVAGLLANYHK